MIKCSSNNSDLTLDLAFPDLYNFLHSEMVVKYEYTTGHGKPMPTRHPFEPIEILEVNGSETVSAFKKHINHLIDKDFECYIADLSIRKPQARINQIKGLIEDLEEYDGWMVKEFEFDRKPYRQFYLYKLEGDTLRLTPDNYSDGKKQILTYVDRFASAYLEIIDRFIQRLLGVKHDIEFNNYKYKHIASLPESFKYKHYSRDPESEGYSKLFDLFKSLKDDEKLIDVKTDFRNFSRIFSGKEVKKPIKWIDDRISSLHYFIKKLNASGKIEDAYDRHFEIACHCFRDPDGGKYIQKKLKGQKKITDFKRFDDLISIL